MRLFHFEVNLLGTTAGVDGAPFVERVDAAVGARVDEGESLVDVGEQCDLGYVVVEHCVGVQFADD